MKTLLATTGFILICSFSSPAQCHQTGPNTPGDFENDNASGSFPFINTGLALGSDNARSTATSLIGLVSGETQFLTATDCGFSIPLTATICGITVELEKSAGNIGVFTSVTDHNLQLLKGGTAVGNNLAADGDWPGGDQYYSYGGSSELWGTTWTPAEINDDDFGLRFSASINGTLGLLPSARIDHVRISVHYLDPLPVRLRAFQLIPLTKGIELKWTTDGNDEPMQYRIQRSREGQHWATFAQVEGRLAPGTLDYRYVDLPASGKYYRLALYNREGKLHSYSPVRQYARGMEPDLQVWPNPSQEYIWINSTETVQLAIYNALGIRQQVQVQSYGNNLSRALVSHLQKGMYVLMADGKLGSFVKN